MKQHLRKIKWIFLVMFILGNIMIYNHAYQFTHFKEVDSKRLKPEAISMGMKAKLLFTGVANPRPKNIEKPDRPFETVYIESEERLEAWWIAHPESKGIVLLFHGYAGSKSGNINYAEAFYKKGYSTFLLDFRGSGGSSGNQTTIGYKESKDVLAALNYIKSKHPGQETVLFGSSMGAVSIMKAFVDYSIEPDKVILECPFGSMKTTTKKRFEALGAPSFPFADILLFYGSIINGFNAFKHNPSSYASSIDVPSLLLYGIQDKRVTKKETELIFANLEGPKQLVNLEDSGHENYLLKSEAVWHNAIDSFLDISE